MSGWADRQRKNEEWVRGHGKHEAMLLECKLREYRNPFHESTKIKHMEREKKKIEAELTKIRQTICHEREYPRAESLSTRSLTMEAIAPRRRDYRSAEGSMLDPLSSRLTPNRVSRSRLSLDPCHLRSAYKSVPETALSVGKEPQHNNMLAVPELIEIREEQTQGGAVQMKGETAQAEPVPVEGAINIANAADAPKIELGSSVERFVRNEPLSQQQQHLNLAVPRLGRRQSTFVQGRQPSFMNRSNTYVKKRNEKFSCSDILSCANYIAMREGIANETLKKLGLL